MLLHVAGRHMAERGLGMGRTRSEGACGEHHSNETGRQATPSKRVREEAEAWTRFRNLNATTQH